MDTIIIRLTISLIEYILISIGPILNPNLDWVPLSLQAARAAGTKGMSYPHAQHMLG